MNAWDVIVVGAGPGGASAAYGLARAGLRVLVLEKARLPRYKPCGGGLTIKVRDALDFDFSSAVESTISQISAGYGGERTRVRVDAPVAWCVMRDRFDLLLAQRAVRAGAELREGLAVTAAEFDAAGGTVVAGGEALRAAFVVGADGVNGIVRRAAGFTAHTRLAVALEAEMDVPPAALDEWRDVLHADFGAIGWGYAWIFPKADHLSIGIGDLVRPGSKTDLRAALARYIAREPSLRGAKERLIRGHRLPLGGQSGRYHAPRAALVGDAAGLVDPFSAEGIYYAIRSGQMAAQEVTAAFASGAFDLSRYTRRINAEINADFRYAWWFSQAFYHLPHAAYRLFARSASVRRAAVSVLTGGATYRQLAWAAPRQLARVAAGD